MTTTKSQGTLEKLGDDAKVGSGWVVHLEKDASQTLPSRGMCYIIGTLNGVKFQTAVEPDGTGSHWFGLDDDLRLAADVVGDSVEIEFEATRDWPEPTVPTDLQLALEDDPEATAAWIDITPAARWDWIRWIQAGRKAETRVKRIQDTISKLNDGKRRPCCFNRNECTLTDA